MYDVLRSSSIHSNKLKVCTVKNTEVMKLSQSVGVARDVSYIRLAVLLQLTKHEFHICSFLNTQLTSKSNYNLESCKMQELSTVVSATPRPHNFLIYACAILLPWLQRLRKSAKLGSYKPVYNFLIVEI